MKKIIALVAVAAACGLAIYGASRTSMLEAGMASLKIVKNISEGFSGQKAPEATASPSQAQIQPSAPGQPATPAPAAEAPGKAGDAVTAGLPAEQDKTPFSKLSFGERAYAEIGETRDPAEPAGDRFVKERLKGR